MNDLFDFTGKTTLIKGLSSGMGKVIAKAWGMYGARVIVSNNDEAACLAVQNIIVDDGTTVSDGS
jgi:NAD(P)-dependent dehydrogenase (short-subunit alcohol dehydrogenase family)